MEDLINVLYYTNACMFVLLIVLYPLHYVNKKKHTREESRRNRWRDFTSQKGE